MESKSHFEVKNLAFSFKRNGPLFFQEVNIVFNPHALNFIQGKNGAGKSTLLRAIQGNIASDEYLQGSVQIDEIEYDLQSSRMNKNIAVVPQNFNVMLVDAYSFSENLQFSLLPRFPGLGSLPEQKPLPTFVAKYGINYTVPISSLSGGQRQILSILMILQRSPKVLFLDEPTATLDEDNTIIIMNFLAELCAQEKVTIVLIVHNKEIIKRYGGKQYFELAQEATGKRVVLSRKQ